MKYLYCIKGCSHCDSREDCPKVLKNNESNLLREPRTIKDRGQKWVSFCSDFFRVVRYQ